MACPVRVTCGSRGCDLVLLSVPLPQPNRELFSPERHGTQKKAKPQAAVARRALFALVGHRVRERCKRGATTATHIARATDRPCESPPTRHLHRDLNRPVRADVPYRGASLPVYRWAPVPAPKGVVVIHGGFDSLIEERPKIRSSISKR
jgi:hypothetical protein